MTTAVSVFCDWNDSCRWSACVDSALPGSQDDASLFSTFDSFPASGPARPTTISQNTNTSHLVRCPVSRPAKDRVTATSPVFDWSSVVVLHVPRCATYLIVNQPNGQMG